MKNPIANATPNPARIGIARIAGDPINFPSKLSAGFEASITPSRFYHNSKLFYIVLLIM